MENVGLQQVQYRPTYENAPKIQTYKEQTNPIQQQENGDAKLWGALAGLGAIAAAGITTTVALSKGKKVDMKDVQEGLTQGIAKFKNGKTVTGIVEDSANGITRQFKDGQLIFKKEVVKNGDDTFEIISKYNKDGIKTSRTINGKKVKLDKNGHTLYADTKVKINDKQYIDIETGKVGDITEDMNFAVKSKAEAPKAEAPKAETPKAETPKAEEPKVEAPKAEAPKAEAPKEIAKNNKPIFKANASGETIKSKLAHMGFKGKEISGTYQIIRNNGIINQVGEDDILEIACNLGDKNAIAKIVSEIKSR